MWTSQGTYIWCHRSQLCKFQFVRPLAIVSFWRAVLYIIITCSRFMGVFCGVSFPMTTSFHLDSSFILCYNAHTIGFHIWCETVRTWSNESLSSMFSRWVVGVNRSVQWHMQVKLPSYSSWKKSWLKGVHETVHFLLSHLWEKYQKGSLQKCAVSSFQLLLMLLWMSFPDHLSTFVQLLQYW